MSAPAIALIVVGSGVYLLIGAWLSISIGALFALTGHESAGILLLQILLCIAVLFLWAPGLILMFVAALVLLPFGG